MRSIPLISSPSGDRVKSVRTVPTAETGNCLSIACRRSTFVALAVAIVGLSTAALHSQRTRLLTGAAYLLTVDTVEAPADYIVPLGGGAETRPFEAAALYRREIAPKVLIFEFATHDTIRMGLAPSGTDLYRQILELEGVPRSAIQAVPGVVGDTWEEAWALRRALDAKELTKTELTTVVVVTSPEHTLRARWAFQKVFAGTSVDVRMAPAKHLRFDETNWWRHDEGVLTYLHEYLKLPYYWARYTF